MADNLPKRSLVELAYSLRARAALITGEKWEGQATSAMMREAADSIDELLAVLTEARAYLVAEGYFSEGSPCNHPVIEKIDAAISKAEGL